MKIVDATSAELDFTQKPTRIVSLVPSVTETLFDLGLEKQLVGVTDYCIRPADRVGDKPKVGGTKHGLRLEKIFDLKPDLVIANAEENRKEDVEALREQVTVWVTHPRTVQEATELIVQLGLVTTRSERAAEIVTQIKEAHAAIKKLRNPDPPPRTLCLIWKDPFISVNSDTYLHELITLCGGQNLFAEASTRYPQATCDQIVAADPEVVLLPSEPYAFGPADRAFWLTQPITAARTGRVHLIPGEPITWHGSRLWLGFRLLTDLLNG